jgi:quercetin dioxygenase-like cupin family protein
MKINHYSEVEGKRYGIPGWQGILARVVIGKDDGAGHFCMRVLEFPSGAQSLRHSHPWEHEMFIHAGGGEIYGNRGWTAIPTGSVVFIPGHEEHQIRNPGEEPLVIVCLVPAEAPEF